jgi:hypothetical protein
MTLLLGNTFPLVLIRRPVSITPVADADAVREKLRAADVHSFWGHANTAYAASSFLGVDVTVSVRPVLALTPDGLPTLDGIVFKECYVVSPDYATNFRPAVGEEVKPEQIKGWQILLIEWQ